MADRNLDSVVIIDGNAYNVKAKNAEVADKVKSNLIIKGNTSEVISYDGSTDKTLTIKGSGGTSISTETDGTITVSSVTPSAHSHSAGVGLIGSGSAGTSAGPYSYKVALVKDDKAANESTYVTGADSKFYAVQLDKNGKLAVNVPWTDSNTQDGNDNQTVKVGDKTFGKNDPVEFAGDSNITVTADTANKKITIGLAGVGTGIGDMLASKFAKNGGANDGKVDAALTADNALKLGNTEASKYALKSDLVSNTNQTIKADGKTFGANDIVELVAGSNVTISGDTTNKKITISSTGGGATSDNNQTVKANGITFGANDVVEFVGGSNVTVSGDAANKKITINATTSTETALTIVDKEKTDDTNLVYAVTNLVESGTNGHIITPTYKDLPTKAYVDNAISGFKNITISDKDPSGTTGDIWFKY
jgi:hypothetical protein